VDQRRPRARSFFRLVETDPPTHEQFLSYYDRGLIPTDATPREIHMYKGVSVFETEEQARKLASEVRRRYDHIAEVSIPEGVLVERQGLREGHHNVYASADDLLHWVVRVVPVRSQSREGR
jgi:hypothetical protein